MNTTQWENLADEFNETTDEIIFTCEDNYGQLLRTTCGLNTFLIIFALTLSVERKYLDESIKQPVAAILAQLLKWCCIPLLVFFILLIWKLKTEVVLGLLVVFCTNTGSISNLVIFYIDGNVSLGICTTACQILLSFALTPFLLLIYSKNWDESLFFTIPYDRFAMELMIVIFAIFIGILVRCVLQPKSKKLLQSTIVVSMIMASLSAIISPLVNTLFADNLNDWVYTSDYQTWAIAILLPVICFVVSHIVASSLCRQSLASGRTLAFLSTGENTTLSTAILAETQLASSLVIPRLVGFCIMLESALFVIVYRINKVQYKELRGMKLLEMTDEKISQDNDDAYNLMEAESSL